MVSIVACRLTKMNQNNGVASIVNKLKVAAGRCSDVRGAIDVFTHINEKRSKRYHNPY